MIYPLYNKTCYSLLESCISARELVQFAFKNEIEYIGIADFGNLHSIVELSMECEKHNIKPVIGAEVKISTQDSCLMYAMNNDGYRNLSSILSIMHLSGKGYVAFDSISDHVSGVSCIFMPGLHCMSRKNYIRDLGISLNKSKLNWYVGCDIRKNRFASQYMSSEFQRPVLAINQACFLYAEDKIAHDVLLCIKNKKYLSDVNRPKSTADMRILTKEAYMEMYKDIPFCLENTKRFAEMSKFTLCLSSPILPKYNQNDVKYMHDLVTKNLQDKINTGHIMPEDYNMYKQRLDYEMHVIDSMGFVSYFLIVSDFVCFAKDNGVAVGIGRGSGAGSLVAWCLRIIDIDPIKFDLVFERFLNPGRVSMPDFDIDFGPSGRDKVIEYVRNKYGENCVAGIVTFGSLSSRAVLKDVGRVMQIPYSVTDTLSKRIKVVYGKPDSLEDTYKNDTAFANQINSDGALKRVLDISIKLEGLPRHPSAHAAGIVIHMNPITDVVPVMLDVHSNMPLIQVTMQHAEMLGLIKFDFLGLTALEIIQDCLACCDRNLDLLSIPHNDKEVFKMLNDGYTVGVFQFETQGMTKLIHDINVDDIEDLIAVIALYRPGPMENIPLFLESKKHIKEIDYPYPALKEILKNTYGVIVYQEQIIKIVQEVAGFSLSEADLMRRSMGKKKVKDMENLADDFIRRTYEKQGGDMETAKDFFDKYVYPFANYGFNRAHAAAYAIIGYQMAYLKKHYTLEFICASMSHEQNNTDKLKKLGYEAKKMGIKFLAPNINESEDKFTIKDGCILFSLGAIKNVGTHNIEDIYKMRNNQKFRSSKHFKEIIRPNTRELEALMNAGAFNALDESMEDNDELFLFEDVVTVSDLSASDKLNKQKSVIGFYIDKTPIDLYPIKNLHFKLISVFDTKHRSVFIIEDVQLINKSEQSYILCSVTDGYGVMSIVFDDGYDVTDLKKYIDKVCCCFIKRAKNKLLSGFDLVIVDEYVRNLASIEILVNDKQQMQYIKQLLGKCSKGSSRIILYIDNQCLEVDRICPDINYLNSLSNMKWVGNAH